MTLGLGMQLRGGHVFSIQQAPGAICGTASSQLAQGFLFLKRKEKRSW